MFPLLSLLWTLVQTSAVGADAGVLVQAVQNGQGLLRGRGSECFAVTPNHVVKGSDGVRLTGTRAVQVDAVFSRTLASDLAILRVEKPGGLACREWSQVDDLQRLLTKGNSGTLSIREADGSQTLVPVSFRGLDDEAVYVRPSQPKDQISQSMSGATLLVDGVAVGMLMSVANGEGTVSQLDDILRISESFFARTATTQEADLAGEYNFGGLMVKVQPSPSGLQYIQAGNPIHMLVLGEQRKFTSPTMPGVTGEFRLGDSGKVELLAMTAGKVTGLGPRVSGPAPDAATMASLAGTYELNRAMTATVSYRNGKLIYRVSVDPNELEMVPTNGLHFTFVGNGLFSLKFQRDASGQVSHFVLYAGETSVVWTRKK